MTSRPDPTLFAALHGELAPHPAPPGGGADAYGLFLARSSALGWLDTLWGMNDAGRDPAPGSRAAWFQVAPLGGAVPVQPFLACAGEVVARLGTLRLDALRLLLPLPEGGGPAGGAVMGLLQEAGWFAGAAEDAAVPVRVTLDSGAAADGAALPGAVPALLPWLRGFKQTVFDCASVTAGEPDEAGAAEAAYGPAPVDALWGGPARHRIVVTGGLAEWSLDALGWLAAFLAEGCAAQGVSGPLLLTATASGAPRT
ncbi:hypothetical protein [Streptomyces lavendulae]|uniref:hypothetical protein n=1 Tax=Streptomyces lavendulae TaxID=1914 RepID=UPI0024A11B17|nr:hypothetical protein Sros01_77210 [Streptomyces roseochromogenus]